MDCIKFCLPCFFPQQYEVDADVDVEVADQYQLMEIVTLSPEQQATNRDNIRDMIIRITANNGLDKSYSDLEVTEELITQVQNLLQNNGEKQNKGLKIFHLNRGYWYQLLQNEHHEVELWKGYHHHKTGKFVTHERLDTFPNRQLSDFG